jgi:hypothetical protein
VQLHVARFEGVAEEAATQTQGEAQMLATWEIIRPMDGAVLARGSSDYRQRWLVGDYAALVTLLDGGLNGVSRDIVACLARLPAGSPTAAGGEEIAAPVACARAD